MDKIALFDLDQTLADFDGTMRRDMARLAAPNEPHYDIYDDNAPDWFVARQRLIKSLPGWWENLPVLPLGEQIFHMAQDIGFTVHILTKGPKYAINAWTEKVKWVQSHFGRDIDITVTQEKGLVYGRVLCDDFPPYMDAWLKHRPRGLGIMPVTKFNADYLHPNVIRATEVNLDAVQDALQSAFDRI